MGEARINPETHRFAFPRVTRLLTEPRQPKNAENRARRGSCGARRVLFDSRHRGSPQRQESQLTNESALTLLWQVLGLFGERLAKSR